MRRRSSGSKYMCGPRGGRVISSDRRAARGNGPTARARSAAESGGVGGLSWLGERRAARGNDRAAVRLLLVRARHRRLLSRKPVRPVPPAIEAIERIALACLPGTRSAAELPTSGLPDLATGFGFCHGKNRSQWRIHPEWKIMRGPIRRL